MTTESTTLRLESVSRGSILYVRLYGAIDETFDVKQILDVGDSRDLIVNTKSIARVSSFGVRQWVKAMDRLATIKNRIILVDCSPVMVMHLNTIANFGDHCDVVSVQAPYYCQACGWDTEATIPITSTGPGQPEGPVTCRRCDQPMALDEEPEAYFRFARPERYRPLDPHLQQFVDAYFSAGRGAERNKLRAFLERVVRRARALVTTRPRLTVWSAGAAGLLLLVFVLVVAGRDPGIPPEVLERYHHHLARNDFGGAVALIDELEKAQEISADLGVRMREEVAARRTREQERAVTDGNRLLAGRDYDGALARYLDAEELGVTSPALHFAIAESLRRGGDKTTAFDRYVRFVDALGDASDKHLDDALYWQADHLIAAGQPEQARPLLERIKAMSRSNYRRSALRLLRSMNKPSPR